MSSAIHTPFNEKHGTNARIDSTIKTEILQREKDNALPCALAFEIVEKCDVSPQQVGITLDLLNLRLTTCQMGLFGHKPKKKIVKITKIIKTTFRSNNVYPNSPTFETLIPAKSLPKWSKSR